MGGKSMSVPAYPPASDVLGGRTAVQHASEGGSTHWAAHLLGGNILVDWDAIGFGVGWCASLHLGDAFTHDSGVGWSEGLSWASASETGLVG